MGPNILHSHFPQCQAQSKPLEFEDPPYTSRKLDVRQILLKVERKNCPQCGLPN
jgi:hypothetical protein